jgi:4-oxalocrotonate tautomerase
MPIIQVHLERLTKCSGRGVPPKTVLNVRRGGATLSWAFCQARVFEGRPPEQKRAFVREVTEAACRTLDCGADSVDIVLVEVKREHWTTGGKLWSDQGD